MDTWTIQRCISLLNVDENISNNIFLLEKSIETITEILVNINNITKYYRHSPVKKLINIIFPPSINFKASSRLWNAAITQTKYVSWLEMPITFIFVRNCLNTKGKRSDDDILNLNWLLMFAECSYIEDVNIPY